MTTLMTTAPLVQRTDEDVIAFVRTPLSAIGCRTGEINTREFLAHVTALVHALPQREFALNLCDNRYLFLVAFCAVQLKRQSNLLPPNKTVKTQCSLSERYESVYVIHDGVELAAGIEHLDMRQLDLTAPGDTISFEVPLDFLSAITFTSGSTGESSPNLKYWRTFVESTKINARYMLPDTDTLYHQLATVPGQHMWGMETSILLPLMFRVCISDVRPLFPQDICNALNDLRAPLILTSTPVHLRAMLISGITFPNVKRVLCATAPLSQALAQDIEKSFHGDLVEVYGCSEVGSMACRHTSRSEVWTRFHGIQFTLQDQACVADAEHLPASVELSDRIELVGDNAFRLLGRSEDMIEIAGKRGSLFEMNKILLSMPAVQDGVVFISPQENGVTRVAAMVVLKEGEKKASVVNDFRSVLDPVFIPRPLYVVDQLPREENGKLSRSKLLALFDACRN